VSNVTLVRFRDAVKVAGLGECSTLSAEQASIVLKGDRLRITTPKAKQATVVPFANCLFVWEVEDAEPEEKTAKKK
jgi:hypothetical protein